MSDDVTTRQTYDRIAATFADHTWNIVLDHALDGFAALVKPEGRVVDLGCGPGRDIQLLRERGMAVIGLDRSTEMLQEVRRRVGGPVACSDMRRLPLQTNSIEGIWMCASLLHIPRSDVPTVLHEAHRVLRSGSGLYISVQQGTGERWVDSEGGQRFFTYFGVDELARFVTTAGFVIQEQWENPRGSTVWLHLLAVKKS